MHIIAAYRPEVHDVREDTTVAAAESKDLAAEMKISSLEEELYGLEADYDTLTDRLEVLLRYHTVRAQQGHL